MLNHFVIKSTKLRRFTKNHYEVTIEIEIMIKLMNSPLVGLLLARSSRTPSVPHFPATVAEFQHGSAENEKNPEG